MATTEPQRPPSGAACPHGCTLDVELMLGETKPDADTTWLTVCPVCLNAICIDADGGSFKVAAAPGVVPLSESAPPGSVMGDAFARMPQHLESLPTPPEVPRRVVAHILDPISSIGDIADTIKADTAFSFKVIKMANSVAFRGQTEITDLSTAAGRLGLKVLLNIAHTLNQQVAYRAGDAKYENAVWQLWNHSIATAQFATALAEATGKADGQLAYLAGLSHDAGKVILLNLLVHHAHRTGDLLNSPTLLAGELDRYSPLASLHVAHHWDLNPSIRQIVLYLNDPDSLPSANLADATRIVALASDLADTTGYGFETDDAPDGGREAITAAASALGLTDDRLNAIVDQTRQQLDDISSFMAVL